MKFLRKVRPNVSKRNFWKRRIYFEVEPSFKTTRKLVTNRFTAFSLTIIMDLHTVTETNKLIVELSEEERNNVSDWNLTFWEAYDVIFWYQAEINNYMHQ